MNKVELKDETAILPNPCYVQCGDNLELLKSQPNESVNMIYCDILYGTGIKYSISLPSFALSTPLLIQSYIVVPSLFLPYGGLTNICL